MKRFNRRIRASSPVIFISGPYTGQTAEERDCHIRAADHTARSIALLGLQLGIVVRTLTPHLNTARWEEIIGFHTPAGQEYFYRTCFDWIIDTADALYYLSSSPGAARERLLAAAIGVPILRDMEEVKTWLLEWKGSRADRA